MQCKGTIYFWYKQIKMEKFFIKVKRDVACVTSLLVTRHYSTCEGYTTSGFIFAIRGISNRLLFDFLFEGSRISGDFAVFCNALLFGVDRGYSDDNCYGDIFLRTRRAMSFYWGIHTLVVY